MLSGDNGILHKATDAKTKSDEAQIRERIQLAYHSALTKDISNNKGDVEKLTLEDELENEFPNKTIGIADSADKKEWIVKIDNVLENVPIGKNPPKISENKNKKIDITTKFEDNYGNKITIPQGFKVIEGENVTDGIVIEDVDAESDETTGNQFVWIPIGSSIKKNEAETIEIKLGRYTFNYNYGTPSLVQEALKMKYTTPVPIYGSYPCYEYEKDPAGKYYGNTKAKNLGEFIASSIDNGGYYLARYEAGVNGTNVSDVEDIYKIDGKNFNKYSTEEGYVVSKEGVGVWNGIPQPYAATVCQNMYKNLNSDLINSYAWDTAIVFIEKCGTNSNYANSYRLQSTITTTGNAKNGSNNDVQCNIFDMAGNVKEWTTETCVPRNLNSPCTIRGGYFQSQYFSTASRTNDGVSYTGNGQIGFRSLLYL